MSTLTANIGTTGGIALDTSVNSLLKPASTLSAVTTVGTITNTVTVKADTAANQTNAFKVDGSATTQPISAASLPLPSGAASSSAQTTAQASLTSIDSKTLTAGQKTSAASYPVVLASDQSNITVTQGALSYLSKARIDYTGTSVTTAAYTTLIATVGAVAVKNVDIFDSSGQTLVLAIGAAGAEVDQFYITPGGVTYSVAIPANTRLSIKAVSATASTGAIAINIFG